jgi:hypothetical protein
MGARDHQALRPAPLCGRSHGSAGVGASLATTSVTPVKPPPSSPRHDPPDGAQARIKPLIQDSSFPEGLLPVRVACSPTEPLPRVRGG